MDAILYSCIAEDIPHDFSVWYTNDPHDRKLVGCCRRCGYMTELSTDYIDEVFYNE